MKKFLSASLLILFSAVAFAQYGNVTYDSQCIAKIVRIDQYDQSTVFFFTVTSPEGRERFSLNENISITVEDSYKKYRLISAGNIPLSRENCVAYLKDKGNTLNFIMEFEKIPLDTPFNIVENPDRNSALTFNYRNVVAGPETADRKIDVNDFLTYTDYVKSGKYSKGGGTYMYYEVNGLSVATHMGEDYSGFTKIGVLNIEVTNESGYPITFSADNIRVTAMKNERKGYQDLPLWGVTDYDEAVRSNNSASVSIYDEKVNPVASTIGRYRRTRVRNDDLGSQILLGSLETIFRSTGTDEVDEYAAALEENRKKLWNNYLQDVRLENGESYGGFVSFRDSNFKHYIVYVTLGGYVYTFNIAA